ncbi:MAG TPA: hypothetical protein VFU81_14290, partial [Thermomicrobiales bacterium]|nr:hypothetical protein [Thermomicrobiales bacterium]
APCGGVTVIAGEHGSGKSLLALDWAAIISTGCPALRRSAGEDELKLAAAPPDAAAVERAELPEIIPSNAVIAHAGDLTLEVLRRRVDAAGGAPERIASLALFWPDKEVEFSFDLVRRRIHAMTCAIRETSDVRLLVIDNLDAFAGNLHEPPSAALLGFLLANLAELAALSGIAIVVLVPLPRAGGQAAARKLDALCNAAPVVYLAASDPQRCGRKLLMQVKNNLAPPAPSRAFDIIDGRVTWIREPVDVAAHEFIAPLSQRLAARHDRESAAGWLLAALADGPVPSRELFQQARDCGISAKTLRRAAASLGLSPRKTSFDGPWQWQMAEPARTSEPEARGGEPAQTDEIEAPAPRSQSPAATPGNQGANVPRSPGACDSPCENAQVGQPRADEFLAVDEDRQPSGRDRELLEAFAPCGG